jgi:leader peptidase (prepilin peptidase)/N-methyltransferase
VSELTDIVGTAPPGLWIGFAFVIGALLGSFLNVVIARVPFGQSIVWPPSHCTSCGSPIAPRHNVPIVSFFALGGRCSCCRAPFSIRYALIELGYGLGCAFAVARHGPSVDALHEMTLLAFLAVLSVIDLDHWILPHVLTRAGIAAGLVLALADGREAFAWNLFAAAVGLSSLMLIAFVAERVAGQEAIGGGDPWLLGMIGAFLGGRALLPVVLLSSLQGTLIGGAMILARRRNTPARERSVAASREAAEDAATASETVADEEAWVPPPTAIPFGPFLALAAAEVHYFQALKGLFLF